MSCHCTQLQVSTGDQWGLNSIVHLAVSQPPAHWEVESSLIFAGKAPGIKYVKQHTRYEVQNMDFRPKYFQVVGLWGVRGFLSGLGFFVCFVGCFFNYLFLEDRGGRFRDAGNSSEAFDFFPSRLLLRVSPIPNGRPVLLVMAQWPLACLAHSLFTFYFRFSTPEDREIRLLHNWSDHWWW